MIAIRWFVQFVLCIGASFLFQMYSVGIGAAEGNDEGALEPLVDWFASISFILFLGAVMSGVIAFVAEAGVHVH